MSIATDTGGLCCPTCGGRTSVKDSRPVSSVATWPNGDAASIRRRRLCEACGFRITTYEVTRDRIVHDSPVQARILAAIRSKLSDVEGLLAEFASEITFEETTDDEE